MVVVVLALAHIVISQHGSEQRQLVIRSTADPAGTLGP